MKAEYKEKLDLIQDSVYDIKNAIIEKGVQIADTEDVTTFAEKIGLIQGGGELPEIHDDDPITFVRMENIVENAYVSFNYSSGTSPKTVFINKNDEGWENYTIGTQILMNYADKVLFKINSTANLNTNTNLYHYFSTSGIYLCGGTLDSLVNNYAGKTLTCGFYRLFKNCAIITAPKVVNVQGPSACYEMFYGCSTLVNAPELPATSVSDSQYRGMFLNCTSLVNAPELPATTISAYAYYGMFYGCTNLVNGPSILPAGNAPTYAYQYMFNDCVKLLNGPSRISATTVGAYTLSRMFYNCTSLVNAPEISATTLGNYSFEYMFYGCTNLVNGPSILPAETLYSYVYQNMFYNCKKLVNAPKLPAVTVSNSYSYMFYNCSLLKKIYCNARYSSGTTVITTLISSSWLGGVPNTTDCIFYKNANWTGPTSRSVSTIPSNWQIATYS